MNKNTLASVNVCFLIGKGEAVEATGSSNMPKEIKTQYLMR